LDTRGAVAAGGRICKAVFDPSPPPNPQIEFEGWHPAHHKRAGQ
jgi:hypothetical protein